MKLRNLSMLLHLGCVLAFSACSSLGVPDKAAPVPDGNHRVTINGRVPIKPNCPGAPNCMEKIGEVECMEKCS